MHVYMHQEAGPSRTVRSVRPVRYKKNSEFSLWSLARDVSFARRWHVSFSVPAWLCVSVSSGQKMQMRMWRRLVQFEVVDKRFHVIFHLQSRWRCQLTIVDLKRAWNETSERK